MSGRKSERDKKGRNVVASCVVICIVAAIIGSLAIAGSAAEQTSDTVTTVNAPEIVKAGETFEASIDVDSITAFNAGLIELSFDASVVNVTGVANGSLDGETIAVDTWGFLDEDTISVVFRASGTAGVNGTGNLTTISFEVVGKSGDRSVLDISDDGSVLVNPEGGEIPTVWIDDEVVVEE
ncbi:MAG: hypothetical protein KAV25_04810 [Methanophagales archaeon]|nr:hypothetical protein [Methanophagales archaeon]